MHINFNTNLHTNEKMMKKYHIDKKIKPDIKQGWGVGGAIGEPHQKKIEMKKT